MATTLSDLLVRLDLDSAKFRDGIEQANRNLTKLNDKVEKMGDGMSASIFKAVASWDLLSNAASQAFQFIANGVKDFADAEKHAFQLSNAITQLGYDSEALLQPLLDQADAFEQSTLASAEQVNSIQQLLLQYGIAPKDIERTTQAVLDYSAATGKDAVQATQKLGKSLNDGNQEFNALGVEMKVTGDAGKDLATVLDTVNAKFGGQAQAQANGMAGAIHRLDDAWGDLGKAVGGFFAILEQKTGLMARFTLGLQRITDMIAGKEPSEHEKTVNKINELLEQRLKLEEKLGDSGYSQAAVRQRILDINEKIAALQKESVAQLKGGATHGTANPLANVGASPEATAIARKGADEEAAEAARKAAKKREEEAKAAAKKLADEAARAQKQLMDEVKKETLRLDPHAAFEERLKEIEKLVAAGLDPQLALKAQEEAFNDLGEKYAKESKPATDAFIKSVKDAYDAVAPDAPELEPLKRTFLQQVGDALSYVGEAIAQAGVDFAAKLGGGAEVVAGAAARLASGDWIGAIIQLFMDLFQNFEGFGRLINQSMGALTNWVSILAPTFEALVEATRPLLGAISYLVAVILKLVQPILDALIPILDSITSIIMVVALLLEGLQPVFEFLGLIIRGIVTVLDVILRGVFVVFQGVGLAMLGVIYAFASAWNGIISAIQAVFRALGSIEIFGVAPLGFLKKWAKGMESAKADTDSLSDAMDMLANATYDNVDAKAEETAATDEATGAIKKMSEALLNVPAIFKVVQARFRAATPELRLSRDLGAIPHFAEGGLVHKSTLALIGEGGEQEIVSPESLMRTIIREEGGQQTFVFNVMAGTGRELYEQFVRLVKRDNFTQTGFAVMGG